MPVDRNVLPPLREPTVLNFPSIEREMLPNGVRLCTIDHDQPGLVNLVVLLRAGSATDPSGYEGLAGLTASLLDEGCAKYSTLDLHKALGDIGGRLSTDVFSDGTVLSITVLERHLVAALDLLVEVATSPCFSDEAVRRVRTLRLSRISQLRHSGASVADRVFRRGVYPSHPYGHAPIGTELGLTAIDQAQLRAFHTAQYAPDRWTVFAGGGSDSSGLRAVVTERISRLPTASLAPRSGLNAPPMDPESAPSRLLFVPRDGAVQSEIRIGLLGVSRHVEGYEALKVMDMVLGGQFESRLNLNLREAKGYTYGVRSSFDARCGRGPFVVQTAVDAPVTAAAIKEVIREITDIRERRPVTDDELDVARSALTRGFPRNFETAGQVVVAAMRLELFGLPDDEYTTFIPRIVKVDRDAVTTAAQRHLDPEGLLTVVVGPPDVRASLCDLGFGEPLSAVD